MPTSSVSGSRGRIAAALPNDVGNASGYSDDSQRAGLFDTASNDDGDDMDSDDFGNDDGGNDYA